MKKFEELNLQLSEIIGTMSKKEKKQYEKDGSSDEIVTFKIILDSDKDCDLDKADEEFPDLLLVTKEKKSYSWFFANIKEDDINSLITKIEEFSISEEDKEEARRLEEEERIMEEQRLQQLKEERELEYEIKMIFASKHIIRDIKEVCEDIEQIIYRLKNQVNFMTFYYLMEKNMEINYKNYSKVFDWYMDLSEKYVRFKNIGIKYGENTKKFFEDQLETITKTYNMLNSVWKVFQAEKKFTEQNFNNIKGKIPKNLILEVLSEDIFGFRKEYEHENINNSSVNNSIYNNDSLPV
jgi:hypothetical protein